MLSELKLTSKMNKQVSLLSKSFIKLGLSYIIIIH